MKVGDFANIKINNHYDYNNNNIIIISKIINKKTTINK